MMPQTLLSCFSAAFAVLAAGLWITSTQVVVPYISPKPGESRCGTVLYEDEKGNLFDTLATLRRQARWNQRAAYAAAAASAFQALSAAPFFGTAPLWN